MNVSILFILTCFFYYVNNEFFDTRDIVVKKHIDFQIIDQINFSLNEKNNFLIVFRV